jgi:alkylation response protein AidB-like acyl-CoA dehydrogenase
VKLLDRVLDPHLELSGLDGWLSDQERAAQAGIHRFAEEVMRPIGRELDRLEAGDVAGPGSPYWTFIKQYRELGVDLAALFSLEPQAAARLTPIVMEELGWGDSGLAISATAGSVPALFAHLSGRPELVEVFGGSLGAWVITQPDRGSDSGDLFCEEMRPGAKLAIGNLRARVTDTEVILDGQSSAWVSNGPVAQAGFVNCAADYGDGYQRADGGVHMVAALVRLDSRGVSRGKPLDKLGQRALPQGEIFFEDVRVPRDHVVADHAGYDAALCTTLGFANMEMSAIFTGVARAAYEDALAYAHERRQGGVPIIEHQSVRLRLFELWRKVESARAMTRRVHEYNFTAPHPHPLASMTAKVHCTQLAFEVANDAIGLLGGNGIAREYRAEKLMRDARMALVEDGENTFLSLLAGDWLSKAYRNSKGR